MPFPMRQSFPEHARCQAPKDAGALICSERCLMAKVAAELSTSVDKSGDKP